MLSDKSGRAKRRRPNLGAQVNGNISHDTSQKNNYLNGPPLRSLAFSTVIKDKDASNCPIPLKSARIQSTEDTSTFKPSVVNQNNSSFFSNVTKSNANTSSSTLTHPENNLDTQSGINIPSNHTSNNAVRSSNLPSISPVRGLIGQQFQKAPAVAESTGSSDIQNITNPNFAFGLKQGGKIRAKVGGGLEQVRAQRGGIIINREETSNLSDNNQQQLQAAKPLHQFLCPSSGNSSNNLTNPFPKLDFTSSSRCSTASGTANMAQPGSADISSFSPKPLASKASRDIIEKHQQVLTRKAGAYDESIDSTVRSQNITKGNSGNLQMLGLYNLNTRVLHR